MTREALALFDMDMTLFDLEGQLRRDLEQLMSPGETMPEDLHDDTQPWLKARIDLIKSVPGWWKTLPIYQPGWDIFKVVEELGFKIKILTKGPDSKSQAWAEKHECIRTHFGDKAKIIIVGEDKSNVYGRVLVDDYPVYITGWLEFRPRGLVIMPAQPYNENFQHPQVIRYTGNLTEIRAALLVVRNRI